MHARVTEVPEGDVLLLELLGQEVHLEFTGVIVGWVGAVEKAGQAGVDVAEYVSDLACDELTFFVEQGNWEKL